MPIRVRKRERKPDVVQAVRDAVYLAGQEEAERMVDYLQRGVQTSARRRLTQIDWLAERVRGVPIVPPEEWLQAIGMEFDVIKKGFKFTVGMFPNGEIVTDDGKMSFDTLARLYEFGSAVYGIPPRPVWREAWDRFLARVDKWLESIEDAIGERLLRSLP